MKIRNCSSFISVAILTATGVLAQTPVILNHSETAFPGDVIYLQGYGFGQTPVVQFSFNDSNFKNLISLQSGSGVITLKIPASEVTLPDLLTLRVSADGSTWSNVAYVNRARICWIDTDQVSAGGSFRIFGRNLFFSRTPSVRFVDAATTAQFFAAVDAGKSLPYVLQVTAPTGLILGHNYNVYVTNGYVGNGTADSEVIADQQLICRTGGVDYWQLGVEWASDLNYFGNIYNIQTDPRLAKHLTGTGSNVDAAVIADAIAAANNAGGGVVFLPAGHYDLYYGNGCGMSLSPRTTIMGAGIGLTTINYGFGVAPASGTGYAVCFSNQSGLSDLTMNNVNESGLWPESADSDGKSEVFLQRVAWNIGTSQWVNLLSGSHIAVEHSKFSQGIDSAFNFNGILNFKGCSWCEITGNAINFAVGGMLFDLVTNSEFEDNVVTRDISLTPDPRSVTHSIEANFTTNFAVLGNVFQGEGNALPTNNDGETVGTEGGGPIRFDEFRGTVSVCTATSLTDYNQDFSHSPNYVPMLRAGIATVAIVSGPGMGQSRQVIALSQDFRTLIIDHPWDVLPEIGSHYSTFDWSANHWIIANNTLSNNFKGLELWGSSVRDVLFQSNSSTDSSGILISPTQAAPNLFDVAWGISVISNTLSDLRGLRPAYIGVVPREDDQTTSFGTNILGIEVRANKIVAHVPNFLLNNPSWDDYKARVEGLNCYWQWQSVTNYDTLNSPAPLLGSIFQLNVVQNAKTAIFLNSGTVQTIFSDTILQGVTSLSSDNIIPGAPSASTGTLIIDSLANDQVGASNPLNGVQPVESSSSGGEVMIEPSTSSTLAGVASIKNDLSANAPASDIQSMVGEQVHGDLSAIVRITLDPSTPASTLGILTMRASLLAGSPFVAVGRSASGSLIVSSRATVSGDIKTVSTSSAAEWVKLSKSGSTFHALSSQDRLSWIDSGAAITSNFTGRLYYVGLSASSGGPTNVVPPAFNDFSLENETTGAPVLTAANSGNQRRSQPIVVVVKSFERFVVMIVKVLQKAMKSLA